MIIVSLVSSSLQIQNEETRMKPQSDPHPKINKPNTLFIPLVPTNPLVHLPDHHHHLELMWNLVVSASAFAYVVANPRAINHHINVHTQKQQQRTYPHPTLSESLVDKRAERRRIMGKDEYKRGGRPFDKDTHLGVVEKMSATFRSEIVKEMGDSDLRAVTRGEGPRAITFRLAKDYGFCWGVERSIELAWAARDAYPDRKMHMTNELIHNPGVNDMLRSMDIQFMEKDAEGEKRFDEIADGDVVILPAFGASLDEMQTLDAKGVTVVDTTCPWVSKVWTTVDKHVKAEMTSVIHGKYAHEESIATASMCDKYIIIKDMDEAEELAAYIMGEPGALTDEELLQKYAKAVSPGFNPRRDLKKIGLANQTTMYKKETQAISRLLERAMMTAHGPENIAERFAAFDTICDATQVRQDAISEMSSGELAADLDFILVVGGWDSSNTAHLLEIPVHNGVRAFHVNEAACIREDNTLAHRDVDGNILVEENVLPADRPVTVGVTSGASTPDSVVQECLERLVLLKNLMPEAV